MGSWGPNDSSCGQRKLWSDWVDPQSDLSLRWAQRLFCWFCRDAAQVSHRRTAKAQASLHICSVSAEPSLFPHTWSTTWIFRLRITYMPAHGIWRITNHTSLWSLFSWHSIVFDFFSAKCNVGPFFWQPENVFWYCCCKQCYILLLEIPTIDPSINEIFPVCSR